MWLQLDKLSSDFIRWTVTKNCQHMPVLLKITNKQTFNVNTEHVSCSCYKCRISVARMHLGCWYLPLSMLTVILLMKSEGNFPRKKFGSHNWLKCSSKVLGNLHSVRCVKHGEAILEDCSIQCSTWIFWQFKNLGTLSREPAGVSCSVDISCLIFIYCCDCWWWLHILLLLLPPPLPSPFCLLAGHGPFDLLQLYFYHLYCLSVSVLHVVW